VVPAPPQAPPPQAPPPQAAPSTAASILGFKSFFI